MTILTDDEAREADMNGARVRLRRNPPYLRCLLCRGDGSSWHPYAMECGAEHPAGWEIVEPRPVSIVPVDTP